MDDMITSQIQNRFRLETDLLRLERQAEESKAALRQAKFDLREAKVAEAEYRGSFRSFKDKLTGKQEQIETALRHAVRKAEADLAAAQRQKEVLDTQLSGLKEQPAQLPDWEALNDSSPLWYRLEALYCTEVLSPMLEANYELLIQRRNQFNGSNAGQVKTWQTLAEIYTAPETAGEACRPYLLRLKAALDALDISFELPAYLEAPTLFLSSATQYTRMDRVNGAILQIEALQRLIPKLQKQLSD